MPYISLIMILVHDFLWLNCCCKFFQLSSITPRSFLRYAYTAHKEAVFWNKVKDSALFYCCCFGFWFPQRVKFRIRKWLREVTMGEEATQLVWLSFWFLVAITMTLGICAQRNATVSYLICLVQMKQTYKYCRFVYRDHVYVLLERIFFITFTTFWTGDYLLIHQPLQGGYSANEKCPCMVQPSI